MAYTLEQGLEVLKETIKGKLTHADYKRVNEIADEYTKYITGEDVCSLLKQFNPREDAELFKQRVALTQSVTSDISNRLMSPMYKIGRSRADVVISWSKDDKQQDKKTELINVANNFYGDDSVENYLTQRMVELDATDPNSFIVVEFSEVVNPADKSTKAKPYPFEVNSNEAVNYRYINNQLQFLIVKNEFTELNNKGEPIVMSKYTIYLDNEAIIAKQVTNENLALITSQLTGKYEVLEIGKDGEKKEFYILITVEHKAGRIPARRVGTKKDLTTRGRTCLPIIHPAHPYFKKSIKTVSEFDLTNCLHTFQQKIQYDEVCDGNKSKQIVCMGGELPGGGKCPECKGSGWKTHTSSADIIRVKLPRDPKDMVSLENYIAYKGPKMDLLEFQKKLGLYELTELAVKAVYTSEIFNGSQVTATATEKTIDLDSVYDTLKPFADSWSAMWKHIINIIASYRDLGNDITIQHQFPKDFKMKSVTMLLEDLSKANTSGAPSYIKNEINKDLAQKIYIDSPNELLKIETKNKFFPFNGKTESEINNIIANDLTSKRNKFLYANFDSIFDKLEQEQLASSIDFYKVESTKQQLLINEKIDAIINEIELELSKDRAISFNSNPIEE